MVTRSGPMSRAVASAIKDAPLLPQDAAAVALVKQYAALLDEAGDETLADVGPKLLRALESLGMTPAGRGSRGGTGGPAVASKLDELRARRAKRAGAN